MTWMIMMMMEKHMVRRYSKKIPYKEVNGHYRDNYGKCVGPNSKDWFDPEEDEDKL